MKKILLIAAIAMCCMSCKKEVVAPEKPNKAELKRIPYDYYRQMPNEVGPLVKF